MLEKAQNFGNDINKMNMESLMKQAEKMMSEEEMLKLNKIMGSFNTFLTASVNKKQVPSDSDLNIWLLQHRWSSISNPIAYLVP